MWVCGPETAVACSFSLTAPCKGTFSGPTEANIDTLFEEKSGLGVSFGNSKAMFFSVFIALRKIQIVNKYLISRMYSKKHLQSMFWG